ncbi:MAG: SymE family type I addiction module toxin [Acidobacteriota bacterium]
MAQAIPSEKQLKIIEHVEAPRAAFAGGRRVPMIRMRGDWLEENGFVAGERVVVTVERGRIVLTLASEA